MLDKVYTWSRKWRIKFNAKKSNIMHIRNPHTPKSTFNFKLGPTSLIIVQQYKYLGVIVNEYVDLDVTAQVLSDSANRALGAIINKYKSINGLGYFTYTKLYQSCVCPILDYASEVWGVKKFPKIDSIQNKAMRIFLGVHKFAANAAISGDMGWISSSTRRKINIVRFWNRLTNMSDSRLPKIIFSWDKSCKGQTWTSHLKKVLNEIKQVHVIESMSPVSIDLCKTEFFQVQCNDWKDELSKKPKLRTYITFKQTLETEPYIKSFMNRKHRSYLSQYRCGILPLEIETGRWINKPLENRICQLCNNGCIEDEKHIIFECSFYENIRRTFLSKAQVCIPNISELSITEQLTIFMDKSLVCSFAQLISDIMYHRNQQLFIEN